MFGVDAGVAPRAAPVTYPSMKGARNRFEPGVIRPRRPGQTFDGVQTGGEGVEASERSGGEKVSAEPLGRPTPSHMAWPGLLGWCSTFAGGGIVDVRRMCRSPMTEQL